MKNHCAEIVKSDIGHLKLIVSIQHQIERRALSEILDFRLPMPDFQISSSP
jgi:hypothetical protein